MINQKIVIVIVLIVVLGGVGFAFYQARNTPPGAQPVNINPNPVNTVADGYVSGHLTIGPNCGGPVKVGQPCPVPPTAYSSRSVIIYKSDGTTIKETGKIDTVGNYKMALAPGNYFVQISPAGIGPGEKKAVTIKSLKTTVVDFDIDTGMR